MHGPDRRAVVFLLALSVLAVSPAATERYRPGRRPRAERASEVDARLAGLRRVDGLLTLHVDDAAGRLYLELALPPDGGDLLGSYIHLAGLATGLGSNPVGLDRGQLGPSRLVDLRLVGGRVLVEERNLAFRARSEDAAERRAARESFATSVLWAGEVVARDERRLLVDLTSFALRDAHGVARALRSRGEGSFTLDASRSTVDTRACLAFPDNVELEALLTWTSSEPGPEVRAVAPDPTAVTLRVHQSFVRLPPEGYAPRRHDPRVGSWAIDFHDQAAPLDGPVRTAWIGRHRLQKVDPAAARSRVREPIVYHVDRGAPEPVRSALLEGARWWARAFDEAGFVDAFRVELMPPGAHPLDVRYNVIQWVHRATRGWSYGNSVVDPRTGEILKGHVTLGSLRVRQDRLLFEGLAGAGATGTGRPDDPVQLALARIRQLSAHEVGHTLGLAHAFAASAQHGRASVMDYPAPLVRVTADGRLDFAEAYGVGVGAWDVHAIRWAYAETPPGVDEDAALEDIVQAGLRRGLVFLSDADARGAGAAHPLASLWDNGTDPVQELDHALAVRAIALRRFGEGNVRPGTPLALLHETFVPVYLHHRYQLAAAAKVLGGVDYRHARRGDGQPAARSVDGDWQRRALASLAAALHPPVLAVPDGARALLLPRPPGHGPHRELFGGATSPVFDPLAAAETAADLVVAQVLQPQRAARLVQQHARDPALPGLEEAWEALVVATFDGGEPADPDLAEIRRATQRVLVDRAVALAVSDVTSPPVRARLEARLRGLAGRLRRPGGGDAEGAHRAWLRARILRRLDRPAIPRDDPATATAPPPGSPIGAASALAACGWEGPW